MVVSRDHLLAATTEEETVTREDLADDVVWLAQDDVLFRAGTPAPGRAPAPYDDGAGGLVQPERPATAADAIAWAATGAGVTVVPMSLARLHHRKDVTFRVLDGGPTAPVGLVWVADRTTDLVEEMVGIVRGRTANSSRGRGSRRQADDGGTAPRGGSPKPAAGGGPNPGSGGGRGRDTGPARSGRGRPRGGRPGRGGASGGGRRRGR